MTDGTHVFMKVTAYMARGVQTIGWSVRMALMALSTHCSGFSGGKNGAISFLCRKHVQNINTQLHTTRGEGETW